MSPYALTYVCWNFISITCYDIHELVMFALVLISYCLLVTCIQLCFFLYSVLINMRSIFPGEFYINYEVQLLYVFAERTL